MESEIVLRVVNMKLQYGGDPAFFGKDAGGEFENAWCHAMDIDCARAKLIKDNMEEYVDELFPAEERNRNMAMRHQWNAFHHSYWMARMALAGFSESDALSLAVAHELDSPDVADRYGGFESRVDMHNNWLGFRTGAAIRAGSGNEDQKIGMVIATLRNDMVRGQLRKPMSPNGWEVEPDENTPLAPLRRSCRSDRPVGCALHPCLDILRSDVRPTAVDPRRGAA
jgi:hypothetical protein